MQYQPNIIHITSEQNKAADMLTRQINLILPQIPKIDYESLALDQNNDIELQDYVNGRKKTSMELMKRKIPNSQHEIIGDISTNYFRVYVTPKFRLSIFQSLQNLNHCGTKRSIF